MHNKKGQIRIIEAFLAALLIFSALILSTNLHLTSGLDNQKVLASLGMQTLIILDGNGTLGRLIDQRNWTAIGESLSLLLPEGISFNLTVYDETMHPINNVIISNGGLGSDEVVSVQFLCASQSPECHCYIVCLQLARAS